MLWQLVNLLYLLGVIFALVQLYKHQLSFQTKTLWCFISLIIPFGWIIYLIFRGQLRQTKAFD
ncbi:PLDc N-terminal domain-containing protein [Spirosoma pollinicola]